MRRHGDPDEPLFDALLTPHRSLSPHGFVILMGGVCAIGCATSLVFYLLGAWPVVGFLGLDVALIYLAFRINYRRARTYETVRLTRKDLVVKRVDPRGEATTWIFQPYWLQVLMDDPPRPDSQLTLRSHGRSLAIGRFLSAEERLDLARALRRALGQARAAARAICAPCVPSAPERA
ncbi:MAG: DUF2244 domain-containing protein [Kiloniellaceae bacterium]